MDHSFKEDTQTDDDTVDGNVAVDLQVQSLLAKEQQPARPASSSRQRKKGLGSKAAKHIMGDIMVEQHTENLLGKMEEKMQLEDITRLLPGVMRKRQQRIGKPTTKEAKIKWQWQPTKSKELFCDVRLRP
jgi:hypothetical protein